MRIIETIIVVIAVATAASFVAYTLVKKGGKSSSCGDCSCGSKKCSQK